MIYTARQLQEIFAGNGGTLRLPLGSRLTPAGNDWVRSRRLTIQFNTIVSDEGMNIPAVDLSSHTLLWWSDGPCGHAKAALASLPVAVLPFAEGRLLAVALRDLAKSLSADSACAVLLVRHAPAACILANRCHNVRAFVATGLDAVDVATRDAAANTIIIEYQRHALTAVRSMLAAFVRGRRPPSAELLEQIKELASCA